MMDFRSALVKQKRICDYMSTMMSGFRYSGADLNAGRLRHVACGMWRMWRPGLKSYLVMRGIKSTSSDSSAIDSGSSAGFPLVMSWRIASPIPRGGLCTTDDLGSQ